MGKRGYHHGDLARAAIVEGLAALDELGVEGVGASEIARRAGVTHAAIHKRLGPRAALLEALAAACLEDLRDVMSDAVRGAGDVPRAQFLAGGWSVVRYAVRHPHRYRLMFAGPGVDRPQELAAATPDTPFGALLELVSGWQDAGLLRRGDRFALAMTIFVATHGLASILASGRLAIGSEAKARALTDRVHQDLLDGLGP